MSAKTHNQVTRLVKKYSFELSELVLVLRLGGAGVPPRGRTARERRRHQREALANIRAAVLKSNADSERLVDVEARLASIEEMGRDVRDLLAEALGYLRGEEDDIVTKLVGQAHQQLEQFGLGDGDPDRKAARDA